MKTGLRACFSLAALALVLILGGLAGCAKDLKQPYPEKRYFGLTGPAVVESSGPGLAGVCSVSRLAASPSYSSRELIYKTGANEFVSDYYNLFLTPPAGMVGQALRGHLAVTGAFAHVLEPGSGMRPDWVMEGSLEALYADFSDPAKPQAVVVVSLFLLKDAGFDYEIVLNRRYEKTATLPDREPSGVVQGMNQALADILGEWRADMARVER